jgi:hypothetical protein
MESLRPNFIKSLLRFIANQLTKLPLKNVTLREIKDLKMLPN